MKKEIREMKKKEKRKVVENGQQKIKPERSEGKKIRKKKKNEK